MVQAAQPVTIDHFTVTRDLIRDASVDPGEFLEVKIINTYSNCGISATPLAKAVVGKSIHIEVQDNFKDALTKMDAALAPTDSLIVRIPHTGEYGGYVVSITLPERRTRGSWYRLDPGVRADEFDTRFKKRFSQEYSGKVDSTSLKEFLSDIGEFVTPVSFSTVIRTEEGNPWNTELSGGFAVSSLTDEKYYLDPVAPTIENSPSYIVRRNSREQDKVAVGPVAFVHIYHRAEPTLALTLGLGSSSSDLDLYTGMSWRMGGKGFLTWGAQFGRRVALPANAALGKTVTDPNLLSQNSTKGSAGLFFALSYAFLSPGEEVFKKPLAPQQTPVNPTNR